MGNCANIFFFYDWSQIRFEHYTFFLKFIITLVQHLLAQQIEGVGIFVPEDAIMFLLVHINREDWILGMSYTFLYKIIVYSMKTDSFSGEIYNNTREILY